MRDQWKRSDSRGQRKGRERNRSRQKPTRKKRIEDENRLGGRPRRSPRQRRLEELAEAEVERMLRRFREEDDPMGL